jgi:hypothetical protein
MSAISTGAFSMELFQDRDVIRRKARKPGNIVAGLKLVAIAKEVSLEISSVPEVIHDVLEVGRVQEPQRVADLMQTSQIDDGVSEEAVTQDC